MSIEFKCPVCDGTLEIEDEHAGKQAVCPGCQANIKVPNKTTVATCPKCHAILAEHAVICTDCGHHLGSQLNIKTIKAAGKAGRFGLALLIGALAAILGGVIWGLIAIWTDTEFGWIAWLVGAITGLTVRMVTSERTIRAGLAAVVLATAGLLLGKTIIMEHLVNENTPSELQLIDAGCALLKNSQNEKQEIVLYANRLQEMRELSDPNAELNAKQMQGLPDDSPEWDNLYERANKLYQDNLKQAEKKYQALSEAEREASKKISKRTLITAFMQIQYLENGILKSEMSDDDLILLLEKPDVSEEEIKKAEALNLSESKRITEETLERVENLSASDYNEAEAKTIEALESTMLLYKTGMRGFIFANLFSLMDLIFFALALITAWQLATRQTLGREE